MGAVILSINFHNSSKHTTFLETWLLWELVLTMMLSCTVLMVQMVLKLERLRGVALLLLLKLFIMVVKFVLPTSPLVHAAVATQGVSLGSSDLIAAAVLQNLMGTGPRIKYSANASAKVPQAAAQATSDPF